MINSWYNFANFLTHLLLMDSHGNMYTYIYAFVNTGEAKKIWPEVSNIYSWAEHDQTASEHICFA